MREVKIYFMSIVTKKGDQGDTGSFGGVRVSKDSPGVMALGDVDELNSCIGLLCSRNDVEQDVLVDLEKIQRVCFIIGAEIATSKDSTQEHKSYIPRVCDEDISFLEQKICFFENSVPRQTNFILPGGHPKASMAFWIRAVARRAERRAVTLLKQGSIGPRPVVFLNRLSDYFYILARFFNKKESYEEKIWSNKDSR